MGGRFVLRPLKLAVRLPALEGRAFGKARSDRLAIAAAAFGGDVEDFKNPRRGGVGTRSVAFNLLNLRNDSAMPTRHPMTMKKLV